MPRTTSTHTPAPVHQSLTDLYDFSQTHHTSDDGSSVTTFSLHSTDGLGLRDQHEVVTLTCGKRYGRWEARVSWASIGSQDADLAYAFALLLGRASDRAARLQVELDQVNLTNDLADRA